MATLTFYGGVNEIGDNKSSTVALSLIRFQPEYKTITSTHYGGGDEFRRT